MIEALSAILRYVTVTRWLFLRHSSPTFSTYSTFRLEDADVSSGSYERLHHSKNATIPPKAAKIPLPAKDRALAAPVKGVIPVGPAPMPVAVGLAVVKLLEME